MKQQHKGAHFNLSMTECRRRNSYQRTVMNGIQCSQDHAWKDAPVSLKMNLSVLDHEMHHTICVFALHHLNEVKCLEGYMSQRGAPWSPRVAPFKIPWPHHCFDQWVSRLGQAQVPTFQSDGLIQKLAGLPSLPSEPLKLELGPRQSACRRSGLSALQSTEARSH